MADNGHSLQRWVLARLAVGFQGGNVEAAMHEPTSSLKSDFESGSTGRHRGDPNEDPGLEVPCDPVVLFDGRVVRLPRVGKLIDGRLVPLIRVQLGLCMILLNLGDVLLTKAILHRGGVEGNPLMRGIMAGFAAPLGTKFLFSATAALLLLMCPIESKLANRAAATVVGIYLAIFLWNSALLGYLTL